MYHIDQDPILTMIMNVFSFIDQEELGHATILQKSEVSILFLRDSIWIPMTIVKPLDSTTTSREEERINKDIVWLKDLRRENDKKKEG